MSKYSKEYARLSRMFKAYEEANGVVDATMPDGQNCSFCSASCFSTNCSGNCMSAIAPQIKRRY
ncbi:MAG: hypothetical protein MJZ42_05480 [Bacteroidales bacterium]|nr:hypothetical protein [Bacteroidales bacterium]